MRIRFEIYNENWEKWDTFDLEVDEAEARDIIARGLAEKYIINKGIVKVPTNIHAVKEAFVSMFHDESIEIDLYDEEYQNWLREELRDRAYKQYYESVED